MSDRILTEKNLNIYRTQRHLLEPQEIFAVICYRKIWTVPRSSNRISGYFLRFLVFFSIFFKYI